MGKIFTHQSFIANFHIHRIAWLFIVFILFCLPGKTQNVPVNDSVTTIISNLNPGQTVEKINIAELQFTNVKDKRINFGFTGREYHYILLKVNAIKPVYDQFLSIDNTSLDTINIYKVNPGTSADLLYSGGQLVPYNTNRSYVWHTAPLAISNIPSYYLIAATAPGKNINIKYAIYPQGSLQKKYETYDSIVFFYIGVASMMAAIIIVAFALFKEKIFGCYLAYITCMSLWIVAHYGRLFPAFYPNFPMINTIVKPISSLASGIFLLLVLRNVFREQLLSVRWLPMLLKGMQYILTALTLLMFLFLINDVDIVIKASLIVLWHLGLFLSIALIVYTPVRFVRTGTLAKIFASAMLVICVMAVVQLFANSGFINNYFINEHGMAMGSLLENSIMAFGLFYNLVAERRSKRVQLLALEQEQKEMLEQLVSVQDNERRRIANDLHDNIGPLLAALKINFRRLIDHKDAMQNGLVHKTEMIIDDTIMEIRDIAHNLMPKGISSKGLINALRDYFERMEPLYKKSIHFNHDVQSIFQPDLQMNIYRVICELVLNAAKHSNASTIMVSLVAGEHVITISIIDNGQGFCICKHKKAIGLQSAESRVHYLKGKFCLASEPGKGTTIQIDIPLINEPALNGRPSILSPRGS